MNICFRLDANNYIGLGHLKRCLQLALDLKSKLKIRLIFIIKENREHFEKIIKKEGFDYFLIKKKSDDFSQTKKILQKTNSKVLILDHYYLGLKWEKKIRSEVEKLIIISDQFRKNFGDTLILQNFEDKIKKKNVLTGKKYFIISKEYRKIRKKNKFFFKKISILINFGSYDINNLTCRTVNFFLKNYKNINIKTIVDKSFKYKRQLKNIEKKNSNLKTYSNLSSLAKITNSSNVCVGSGGVHNYERIFLGKLSYVIMTDKNQKKNIDFLNKKKLIIYLGTSKNFSFKKIKNNHLDKNFLKKKKKKII